MSRGVLREEAGGALVTPVIGLATPGGAPLSSSMIGQLSSERQVLSLNQLFDKYFLKFFFLLLLLFCMQLTLIFKILMKNKNIYSKSVSKLFKSKIINHEISSIFHGKMLRMNSSQPQERGTPEVQFLFEVLKNKVCWVVPFLHQQGCNNYLKFPRVILNYS